MKRDDTKYSVLNAVGMGLPRDQVIDALVREDPSTMYMAPSMHKNMRGWVIKRAREFKKPVILTLTYRYDLSVDEARNKYNRLIRMLSRKYFEKPYRKRKELIREIGFVEGSSYVKPHIHCLIDVPLNVDTTDFLNFVKVITKRDGFIDTRKIYSEEGWMGYCSKLMTKGDLENYSDSLLLVH